MIERAHGAGLELKAHPTSIAMPAAMRRPTGDTILGQFSDGRAPIDHEHAGVHGIGAEQVQGFLAGVNWLAACGHRGTGFDTVIGADRGGIVEILSRMRCSKVCRSLIPRVVCS